MRRRKDDLADRFRSDLVQGCHVIVGLSGGADSVSLLHYLWKQQETLGCTVEAAHLNHCLRGAESDRDENFVRQFCAERGIFLTVRRTDIAALAKQRGMSAETCGREERYTFFEELASFRRQEGKQVRIATAHTLSDDLETVLFRMARGTGLDGLCGIPVRRGDVIRPLLECTRTMTEEYCAREGICFVIDSSNADTVYARNRIRAEAVPALKEINEAVEDNFLRQKQALTEDRDFLEEQTRLLLEKARLDDGVDTEILRPTHPALQRRIAVCLLREQQVPVDQNAVLAVVTLIQNGHGRAELRPGLIFAVRRGILRVEQEVMVEILTVSAAKEMLADGYRHLISVPYTVYLGDLPHPQEKHLWLQVISAKDWTNLQKVYENLLFFAIDYDTIIGSLIFRSRMAGDILAQPSRGGRTLKKLFSEAGFTALQRQTNLVAADNCSVLWAEGFEADRRVIVGPDTKNVLLAFRVLPENE